MSLAATPIPATPIGEPLADYVRPRGFRVIAGDPRCRSWRHYLREEGGFVVSSGLWEATEGAFAFRFEHWEFFHVIAGAVRITPEGGEPMLLRAGEAMVMEPGFEGRWEVLETMLKHYVSRVPA
jgi:uncharacterized cupin superfamily protein